MYRLNIALKCPVMLVVVPITQLDIVLMFSK